MLPSKPRHRKLVIAFFCVGQLLIFVWVNLIFQSCESKFSIRESIMKRIVSVSASDEVKICSRVGTELVGTIDVYLTQMDKRDLVRRHSVLHGGSVQHGGWWKPSFCNSKSQVAILVPFRNRTEQLHVFLNHMHPLLQKQQLSYRIFVIEQVGATPFNKGVLYNLGFRESAQFGLFDCFIFHDVDLLSENDENYYGCPVSPLHMSVAIDKFKYRLPYSEIFGGVVAFEKSHYVMINGFSNSYYGWGGEDDDLYMRVKFKGLHVHRPPLSVGRYTMNQNKHFRSSGENTLRQQLLQNSPWRVDMDGLNSVRRVEYTKNTKELPLYTLIKINIE